MVGQARTLCGHSLYIPQKWKLLWNCYRVLTHPQRRRLGCKPTFLVHNWNFFSSALCLLIVISINSISRLKNESENKLEYERQSNSYAILCHSSLPWNTQHDYGRKDISGHYFPTKLVRQERVTWSSDILKLKNLFMALMNSTNIFPHLWCAEGCQLLSKIWEDSEIPNYIGLPAGERNNAEWCQNHFWQRLQRLYDDDALPFYRR